MKDTHNIRINTTLREAIRLRGAHNGFAWTKQMHVDLEELYAMNPANTDNALQVVLQKHADSCGITLLELMQRCVSVLQIQVAPPAPLWPKEEEDVEHTWDLARYQDPALRQVPLGGTALPSTFAAIADGVRAMGGN